ncbi:VanZ family protein [Halomonas sp. TRM85114]|uniref:VanZ family protein n=1 Tax=Halomonas jincaotanensis TaxID=2810616 RepID=UPI001BD45909|nr:VanZ family protein [Halomonas jincaotanensis]MBS9404622.1 VanZ family protein [Halomonas jincaotanensis]
MVEWLRRVAWSEDSKWRRRWALLAGLAALMIAFGSLVPGNEMPSNLPWDKANHFIGYAGLSGLMGLAGVRLPLAFVAALSFGIAIELLQIPVAGRGGGDWADILANGLGAAAAVVVLLGLRSLPLEQRSG